MTVRFEHDEIESLLRALEESTGREREDVLLDVLRREFERLEKLRRSRELSDEAVTGASPESAESGTPTVSERDAREAIASGRLLHERVYARRFVDRRPIDEILAYDENGLPV